MSDAPGPLRQREAPRLGRVVADDARELVEAEARSPSAIRVSAELVPMPIDGFVVGAVGGAWLPASWYSYLSSASEPDEPDALRLRRLSTV